MAALPAPRVRRRRRPRRGSLERPVNGRLYRASFLVAAAAAPARSRSRSAKPAPLQGPLLPPAFDASVAAGLARELATEYPDRSPGSSGALAAADWFRRQARGVRPADSHGLRGASRSRASGSVRLQNVTAVVTGQSPDVIVVMAHRDDTGAGPGANDNASGTAALLELARAYARPQSETPGRRAADAHARLPLDRRRRLRRPRRAPLRAARGRERPRRRSPQPRHARRAGPARDRARRRPAALAGHDARADRVAAHRRADGEPPAAPGRRRAADRPRPSRSRSTSRARSSRAASRRSRSRAPAAGPPPSFGDSAGRLRGASSRSSAGRRRRCSARSTRASSSRRGRRATSGSATGSCVAGRSSWC